MGGRDKLAIDLRGRPLLAWTLEAIRAAGIVRRLVLVTAAERVEGLRSRAWLSGWDAELISGGQRRQESVAAGIERCEADVVLVHDAARPLVSPGLVRLVAERARSDGAALPVTSIGETVKRLEGERVAGTLPRDGLATAQTPQGVRRALLLAAYRHHDPYGPRTFTDEASLLEAVGVPVTAVPGEPTNIKVTRPEDVAMAEGFIAARLGPPRVGLGTDSHPFGPEDGLRLGGLVIREAPRLHGHSDGDVVLHAVADALLGAAGLGDLGRLFPAGDPITRGIASAALLERTLEEVAAAGYRPISLDLTITGARPRLGGARLDEIRDRVAELLGLEPGSVGVKASTGNWSGPEGAGRAVSASVVVTIMRR